MGYDLVMPVEIYVDTPLVDSDLADKVWEL
jgi:hypothetical protein